MYHPAPFTFLAHNISNFYRDAFGPAPAIRACMTRAQMISSTPSFSSKPDWIEK